MRRRALPSQPRKGEKGKRNQRTRQQPQHLEDEEKGDDAQGKQYGELPDCSTPQCGDALLQFSMLQRGL